MSYDFRHIMWKKDNPTNNLVMTVSEDNSETKKKKKKAIKNPTPFWRETGTLVSY